MAKTSKKQVKKKSILKYIHKRITKIRKAIGKYIKYKFILPILYKIYSYSPIDNKLIIFADYRDRDMPDVFLDMYDMCIKNGYRCEFLSGSSFGRKILPQERKLEQWKYDVHFIKMFAQCRALFLLEYFPLVDTVSVRKETDVIQLWHACGLLKTMGYAVIGKNWGPSTKEMKRYPMHTAYTLVTVSSDKVVDGYQEAFRCNREIIKPLGISRTDVYFKEGYKEAAYRKIKELFPEIGKRKIILYAPTFRGKSISKSYIEPMLNYEVMKEALAETYVLVTKFHPLMAKEGSSESERLRAFGFVFDITNLLLPAEALCAADILITDYSSIIFEYLLLERPIISYVYDLDTYKVDRGFFDSYDRLVPGPYVFTQEELIERLLTVDEWFDIDRIRRYKEQFMSACDGKSTERIFNYVFNNQDSLSIGEHR